MLDESIKFSIHPSLLNINYFRFLVRRHFDEVVCTCLEEHIQF